MNSNYPDQIYMVNKEDLKVDTLNTGLTEEQVAPVAGHYLTLAEAHKSLILYLEIGIEQHKRNILNEQLEISKLQERKLEVARAKDVPYPNF